MACHWLLKESAGLVDTVGMSANDLTFEPISDDCLNVLGSYAVRDATARAANPEYNGWLDRVDEVAGVDKARLTSIHGYLIAQGMLKFEITGRSIGLQYQVSLLGRESLSRSTAAISAERPGDDFEQLDVADTTTQNRREAA